MKCAPGDEALVRSVLDGAFPSQTVKESSLRAVRRITPPHGPALYLKMFHERGVGAAVRRLIADRAAHEFAILDHLRRAGVPAAEPVACGARARASFLITREVAGAEILKDRLVRERRAGKLMETLGGFVRSIHDAGVRHDDLHVGNVLVSGARLYLVDVHRAAIRSRLSRAERIRGLGFLLLSLDTLVRMGDKRRLLRAYWGKDLSKAVLRDVGRAFRRAREKYAADRAKRCLGSGREFEKAGGMLLRRPLSTTAATASFKAPPHREVKSVGRRRLWLVTPDRFIRKGPRSKRIWTTAHALAARHVATPRLWACGGDCVLGEWIADALPLNEFVAAHPGEKRKLRDALAAFVRRMHRAGVHHGDLKANNVLVRPGLELLVIDLDRTEFFEEVPLERRLSDLAQLNAALGAPVTRGDRLAFYRIYAGRETDWQRGWKEKVREIMKRTKARKHVWPKEDVASLASRV